MRAIPSLLIAAALLAGCGPAATPAKAMLGQDAKDQQAKDGKTAGRVTDEEPKQLQTAVPEGLGPEPKPLADGGESYTLRLRHKPGDTIIYQFRNRSASMATAKLDKTKVPDGKWEDASMSLDGDQTMKVVENKDGYFKIDRETRNLKGEGTGFGKKQAEEDTKAGKIFKDSILLSEFHKYPDASELSDPFTNALNGLFPKNPVKVGDYWEYDAFRSGNKTSAAIEGVDEVQGIKCLRFELKFPALAEGSDDRMWIWIDPQTGVVEKAILRSVSDIYGIDTYTVHSQWRQR